MDLIVRWNGGGSEHDAWGSMTVGNRPAAHQLSWTLFFSCEKTLQDRNPRSPAPGSRRPGPPQTPGTSIPSSRSGLRRLGTVVDISDRRR